MGRKLKKGKAGNAAQYITRTKAIRKLQLRLSEFRRLCILKGVHPREPKKKVHGANKTYYHTKDINWLMHEPLLQIFRNMKAHQRKVRKAYGKFNPELAARLRQLTPTYKLDRLVKERYPSFVDALRDLDDALTMVHLFATLPAEKRLSIPSKAVELAKRLALEWNAWVVRSSSLRKVFVSVKGIYFQAEVLGQAVTWLVPHQLAQVLPLDVDYKVMLTFLEFHECLLQFVNFKLYNTLGLKYPPINDAKLHETAADLAAVMRELAGVREEESKAADSAVAALKADLPTSQEPSNAQAAARLKQLDAAKIAALAGTESAAGTSANGHSQASGSDPDSEDAESDELPEIDSEADEESVSASDDDDNDNDDGSDEQGSGGDELMLRQADEEADEAGPGDRVDGEVVAGGALGEGISADDDAAVCSSLFKGMVFFLAREVPREPLALVIRSFGGIAAWDGQGSQYAQSDDAITHQVVDRPTQGHKFLARHYVQPQWVIDSANFRVLLPTQLYTPGKVPPPHLSPFVNDEEEGYTPDWAKEVKKLQEAAKAARLRASGLPLPEGFAEDTGEGAGEQQAAGGVMDDASAAELAHQLDLAKELKASLKRTRGSADSDAGSDDDDAGEGSEEDAELQQVLKQRQASASKVAAQEAADQELLKDVMMTRKTRKVYERIRRAREGKKQRVEHLEERKAALSKRNK